MYRSHPDEVNKFIGQNLFRGSLRFRSTTSLTVCSRASLRVQTLPIAATMFPQLSTFFSDLKLGFKSSIGGGGSGPNKGSYKTSSSSKPPTGCFGRGPGSGSTDWGLKTAASRKRRSRSTDDLRQNSAAGRRYVHHSALSLVDLPPSRTKSSNRHGPGVDGGSGGLDSNRSSSGYATGTDERDGGRRLTDSTPEQSKHSRFVVS